MQAQIDPEGLSAWLDGSSARPAPTPAPAPSKPQSKSKKRSLPTPVTGKVAARKRPALRIDSSDEEQQDSSDSSDVECNGGAGKDSSDQDSSDEDDNTSVEDDDEDLACVWEGDFESNKMEHFKPLADNTGLDLSKKCDNWRVYIPKSFFDSKLLPKNSTNLIGFVAKIVKDAPRAVADKPAKILRFNDGSDCTFYNEKHPRARGAKANIHLSNELVLYAPSVTNADA